MLGPQLSVTRDSDVGKGVLHLAVGLPHDALVHKKLVLFVQELNAALLRAQAG